MGPAWDDPRNALWSAREPRKGEWDWKPLDEYVDQAEREGIEPLLALGTTPARASTDTSYGNYLGVGSFGPPKDLKDWENYVRQVVTRYRGRVKAYEVWNEPNNNEGVQDRKDRRGFFFYGSNEDYFDLLKTAYQTAKSADPDALSIHAYSTPFPPEVGYYFNNEKDAPSRVRRARR